MITLTENAVSKVDELITAEGEAGLALRVAVRPGGCSGFSYEMYFDAERAADDMIKAYGGVEVVIDPSSAQLLEGATLDYKDGLQDAGFAIDNPNAQKTCGCGSSFS
jgi:iron-sulfur cluster assembly accessory protein